MSDLPMYSHNIWSPGALSTFLTDVLMSPPSFLGGVRTGIWAGWVFLSSRASQKIPVGAMCAFLRHDRAPPALYLHPVFGKVPPEDLPNPRDVNLPRQAGSPTVHSIGTRYLI